jgi:hypothetical protein
MTNLLNRGLNFSILPRKLDISEVLVNYSRFERSAIWQEFWYDKDNRDDQNIQIFKIKKNNLPKNYTVPSGLKTFLGAVRSEIMDPRNRNAEECNIPQVEIEAVKELLKLQRERHIVVKACDKGAGIIILEFQEYLRACYEHLYSTQSSITQKPYYEQVKDTALEEAKQKIKDVLQEGLDNEILSKEEFQAMNPEDKNPAKFYCNFKIHKKHNVMEAPPPRPIISGSGSILENIGKYVEYHIKNIANKHESYLQDTPHFLRTIEQINGGPMLPQNAILVTIDIQGAYQNIPQDDGIECLLEELEEQTNHKIPPGFIARLMELILKHNIFEFHGVLWRQLIGTAMGTPPAPSYANIYIARRMDGEIKKIGFKYGKNGLSALKILKRFLDDIFQVFIGSTKTLHDFFNDLNEIHPTLKFTMTHTSLQFENESDKCPCESNEYIPFLDTACQIISGRIETDLYRKKTDRNQYLLPSSCHSKGVTKNIPFSLGLRIIRICSQPEKRDLRLEELKELLLIRGYSLGLVQSALDRARAIPRKSALRKSTKNKQNENRPVFVIKYDPRLPAIQSIMAKHWRAMISQDKYLGEVFPQPPLTAFKRQNNIRNYIIRSKLQVPIKQYTTRKIKGMTKCGKACTACPFILEGKYMKIDKQTKWIYNKKFTCENFNIIYMIQCEKENCKKQYIGETGRTLKHRLADHRGYVINKMTNKATGAHFNSPGHSLANLKITILEQVKKSDIQYRKEREKYFIKKFNTYYDGLNRQV